MARHDFILLVHQSDRLTHGNARLAPVALGVVLEGFLQVLGDADVVHHQTPGFAAKDPVDAGDGLHQVVAAHGLIHIHGVEAGGIEAGEPHIADNDQLEGVVRVAQALAQGIAAFFAANVGLKVFRVAGAAGHHHFEDPVASSSLCQSGRRAPVLVEFNADAAAHADDQAFAVHGGEAVLEVLHDVGGHQGQSFGGAHHGFELCPLALELFAGGEFFPFGDVFKVGVDVGALVGVEVDLGQAGFVVDLDGGPSSTAR
jgi:hypothetical protein